MDDTAGRPATYWSIPRPQEKNLGRIVHGAFSGYEPGPANAIDKVSRIREFLAIPSRILTTSDAKDWRSDLRRRMTTYRRRAEHNAPTGPSQQAAKADKQQQPEDAEAPGPAASFFWPRLL